MEHYEKRRGYTKEDVSPGHKPSEMYIGVTTDRSGDLCFWFDRGKGGSAKNNIATSDNVTFEIERLPTHIYAYLIEWALLKPCHFFWRNSDSGPFSYCGASNTHSAEQIGDSDDGNPIYKLAYL
ncbi:hypothetical protein FACS189445_6300 [Spirochaetia bacterium]|nr:hypothetical protein FACS189445_6300 [Spirochaetia bacterium]